MRQAIKILLVILILTFNSLAFDNFVEDGWKGIKPLKTSRGIAEKVLGTHQKVTKFGLFNYVTADFFAQADYSDFPCEESSYGRGDYNVSPETVLNYKVIFYKQMKLNDLKFQRKKYRREEDSEMTGLVYYINADDAVIISVRTKNGVEYVAEIRFDPTPADKKKFECKNSELAIIKPRAAELKSGKPPKTTSKIKFSSVYTKLNSKTCKPTYKPESDADEPPEICTGYRGYKIYIQMHGISRFWVGREISKDLDSWNMSELSSFLFSGGEPVIEWRLADGEPFACIVRAVYDKQIFDADEKGIANNLIVQNLKGFAPISVSIDATKNKSANEEARRAADAGYEKL